ncbi:MULTISPECIES: 2-dehydro-3-deoxygalactonokinase [Komagataeibacter]|uniref:2-dehydro-3-deoxygalactonokinase n=1 Tax=Komagataeibacter oboediens TaxID=65958 RepID=A0ABS5SRI9_9PROT|nr:MULTISPECIES: 2-dehydro-3-deoxygalactonokinase [Komagataeibacter]MBE7731341.1 2-dehydro-3-deoxygalactonokinase [Komagataeibacter sp. FXV3]MBT0676922.1 2-dehydro-3-deoxygalactonokinase [Komagataeibacter oboediens]MBT0680254.1 2-dehydro-3-deoxygalactonokinase [Komagataeibacter oboediens]GCE80483.1 2-keto-3-deoxy-galactonokinase [Komagataeibacter oboediens]GCE91936.1 2-keto-3-deoxy-galactonokinase [Komagataeibacter diospyri]
MKSLDPAKPALLGLDWGTSSLRAWLLDAQGIILHTHHARQGILHLPDGGFAQVLSDILAQWRLNDPVPMLACGMVGSINGWREVSYLPCPASLCQLADGLGLQPTAHGMLHIVPGLLKDGSLPDVMRGEETQIVGIMGTDGNSHHTVVLPGTHSKWAQVQGQIITEFRTFMTGELFAVLMRHSILGRLPSTAPPDDGYRDEAFAMGVRTAQSGIPLAGRLFSARTVVLRNRLERAYTADYLSGLLIGEEIHAGMAALEATQHATPVLVGERALCQRYRLAFTVLGHPPPSIAGNTAPAGLFRLACAAHLLDRTPSHLHDQKGAVI